MATNAGTIFVELQAKVGKFKKDLKTAKTGLTDFNKKTMNFLNTNKIAIAAVFAGVGAAVIKVTNAASRLQETQAKFDTVFRGSTQKAEEWAQVLQDSYFMSENAAKNYMASIQDTLVPMGLARDEAAGLSNEIIKLAADLGSFNNVPTATVVRDLQSALVGNTETVKKYGVVLRATDIANRALVDTGKENVKQLTNAEKVTAAYKLILEGTEDAQGDMARTSESYANQVKKMSSALENLMTTTGELTIGPMTVLVQKITELSKSMNDIVETISLAKTESKSLSDFIRNNVVLAITAIIQSFLELSAKIPMIGMMMRTLGIDVDKTISQIGDWGISLQKAAKSSDKEKDTFSENEDIKQEKILETKTVKEEIDVEEDERIRTMWDERMETWIENKQKELALDLKFKEILGIQQNEWSNFAKATTQQVFEQFGEGVADAILEGRKMSDVMKSIFKDLTRAIIAFIAKWITKMLIFLALKAAAGFATGGVSNFAPTSIASLPGGADGGLIREPSIITGLRSGKSMVAGEAGTEALLPTGGAKGENITAKQMGTSFSGALDGGGGGGGANINITISGQFIEGNPSKWQKLIRDKIVPELRRRTMIDPTGLFNRRRGATT